MKVLIADDEPTARELLMHLLRPYGTCIQAADGIEAVALFKEALAANDAFDLVLLDIMMPEMDGQQALKKIRAAEKAKYGISLNTKDYSCILMVTSLDDPIQLIEAYTKGKCNGYLNKPLLASDLLYKLKKHNLLA